MAEFGLCNKSGLTGSPGSGMTLATCEEKTQRQTEDYNQTHPYHCVTVSLVMTLCNRIMVVS